MEVLLNAADELSREDQPDRPDFGIPQEYSPLAEPNPNILELRDSPQKGKGWLPRTTCLPEP